MIWNTIESLDAYQNKDDTESNIKRLVNRIQQHLKDGICCFKASGVANDIMHKAKARTILNLVTNKDEDESLETDKVAMQIKSRTKNASGIKDKYPVLDQNFLAETILPTLSDILAIYSPNLTTPSLLLCIVASCLPSLVRMHLCFKLLCDCLSEKKNH